MPGHSDIQNQRTCKAKLVNFKSADLWTTILPFLIKLTAVLYYCNSALNLFLRHLLYIVYSLDTWDIFKYGRCIITCGTIYCCIL
ncbi:hypothetical protein BS78_08G043100 [Paspalum vaginatum]|nr:hypothetical protein BS78_08G043100 [Paspalum vaginatum]